MDPGTRPANAGPDPEGIPAVTAIVLAAGRSTRMGSSKPTLRLAGRPLLEHVLSTLSESHVSQIVVVLGYEAARVRAEVRMSRAAVVVNPDFDAGMSTSIRAGLRAADPASAAYLVVLGDQPFVASSTVDAVIREYAHRGARIVIPTYRGRRGNPVLIERTLASEIEGISGDVGFRRVFERHRADIREVAVDDPGVLFDLDTPEQLRALEEGMERGRPVQEVLRELVAGPTG